MLANKRLVFWPELSRVSLKKQELPREETPLGCRSVQNYSDLLYLSCCFFLQKAYLHLVLGAKTKEGEDILVLNPSKIPSKREFTGKKEYSQVMDSLFL